MTKIKSIPKADVEKLIHYVEHNKKRVHDISFENPPYSEAKALGYAEGTFEMLIKKLKGDYPI